MYKIRKNHVDDRGTTYKTIKTRTENGIIEKQIPVSSVNEATTLNNKGYGYDCLCFRPGDIEELTGNYFTFDEMKKACSESDLCKQTLDNDGTLVIFGRSKIDSDSTIKSNLTSDIEKYDKETGERLSEEQIAQKLKELSEMPTDKRMLFNLKAFIKNKVNSKIKLKIEKRYIKQILYPEVIKNAVREKIEEAKRKVPELEAKLKAMDERGEKEQELYSMLSKGEITESEYDNRMAELDSITTDKKYVKTHTDKNGIDKYVISSYYLEIKHAKDGYLHKIDNLTTKNYNANGNEFGSDDELFEDQTSEEKIVDDIYSDISSKNSNISSGNYKGIERGTFRKYQEAVDNDMKKYSFDYENNFKNIENEYFFPADSYEKIEKYFPQEISSGKKIEKIKNNNEFVESEHNQLTETSGDEKWFENENEKSYTVPYNYEDKRIESAKTTISNLGLNKIVSELTAYYKATSILLMDTSKNKEKIKIYLDHINEKNSELSAGLLTLRKKGYEDIKDYKKIKFFSETFNKNMVELNNRIKSAIKAVEKKEKENTMSKDSKPMVFKFKDGIKIEVTDSKGKTFEEIKNEVRSAHDQFCMDNAGLDTSEIKIGTDVLLLMPMDFKGRIAESIAADAKKDRTVLCCTSEGDYYFCGNGLTIPSMNANLKKFIATECTKYNLDFDDVYTNYVAPWENADFEQYNTHAPTYKNEFVEEEPEAKEYVNTLDDSKPMVFKFKDGIKIEVTDFEGKSLDDIQREVAKAHSQFVNKK